MNEPDDHWQRLIDGLRSGDRQIIMEFCTRYGTSLERLAARHMTDNLRRRVGPEDVVQSACRTFFRRIGEGEFQLTDSDSLWRLLCAITLTKVREQSRFHLRKKRGMDLEVNVAKLTGDESGVGFVPVDPTPSPAEAAEFADQFQKLLASLDTEEKQIIDLKLQHLTNEEVARQIGCSERTVRRILKRLQQRLQRVFEISPTDEQVEQ